MLRMTTEQKQNMDEGTSGNDPGNGSVSSECIICFSPFAQNQSPSREIAEERELVFNKILKILKVNLSPFRWNFEMESFPFCERCTEDVRQQIWFHDRLIEIQAGIKNGKAEIQRKIRESDSARQLPPTDVKVIIFRGQVLSNLSSSGNEDLRAETIVGLSPSLLEPSSLPLGILASPGTQEDNSSLKPSSNNRAPLNINSTVFSSYSPRRSQGFYQLCQVENVPLPPGLPANAVNNPYHTDQTINNPLSAMFVVGDNPGVSNHDNHVAANETVPLHPPKCAVFDDDYDRCNDDDYGRTSESDSEVPKPTEISSSKRKAEKRKGSNSKTSSSCTPQKSKRIKNQSRKSPDYSPDWNNFDNQSEDSVSSFPEEQECEPKPKLTIKIKNSKKSNSKDKPKPARKTKSKNVKSRSRSNLTSEPTKSSMNPNPVVTDSDGRQFIQDIEIIVLNDGFGCGACDFKVAGESRKSRLQLRDHIRGFHLNAFYCNTCEKSFKTSTQLSHHNNRVHVHGKTECPDCLKPIFEENLKVHQFTHKNDEEKAQAEAAGLKPIPKYIKPVGGIICVYCGLTFSSIFTLRKHEELHSAPAEERKNIICPNCQRKFSQQKNLVRHLARNCKKVGGDQMKQEKRFACQLCEMRCYSKSHLTAHKLTHLKMEERTLQCPICARKISSQRFYDEHAVVHIKRGDVEEDFKYPCNVCGLKFKIKASAGRHMRNHPLCSAVNSKVKELQPEDNNIVPEFPDQDEAPNSNVDEESTVIYSTGTRLTDANKITCQLFKKTKDGQLTFRGIKITPIGEGYTCGQCDKDIIHRHLPKRMIREHINGYHFGSYRCQHCNVYYRSRGALTQHFSCSHGTITCGICGMGGLGKVTKVSHSWSHKSEEEKQEIINSNEPWKIPFSIRSDLGIKGVVSWSCSSCPDIFSSRSELTSHQQQGHNLGTPKAYKRSRRKPCPKSKIQTAFTISTTSDSEDFDNYQSENFPSSGISEHRTSLRQTLRSSKFQEPVLDCENLRAVVSIPRLPDIILHGKDFVCLGDNRLSFTTAVGTNRQLLLESGQSDEDIDYSFRNQIKYDF